ncbi:MAG TPA: glycosyltransferase [Puia sp.]|nr:glycosyltransferase [Puia sp.]
MNTAVAGNAQEISVKGRDMVIIGLQPWYYEIGSNCKNIATHLALDNRVLYVNLPMNRKTWYSKHKSKGVQDHYDLIRNKGEKIRRVSQNMWEFYPPTVLESINWLPSTSLFRMGCRLNNRRFAHDIRQAAQTLGFRDLILFNDNDVYNGFYLKEYLSPDLYIYYMRDFLQGYDYFKKHLPGLEPELIKKADFVAANSIYYTEYAAEYNSKSSYMGQGCNLELFDPSVEHPRPQEMAAFRSPVIGYVGALDSERLDEKIIEGIALANPAWNVVLVGPEDSFFAGSRLHGIPNVHFLGRKPLQQLPAYINAFDICINPQLINTITRGNYPLKIDEYLAMGKPVVASRTRAMKLFEGQTYLADRQEEYPGLIMKALAENSQDRQQQRLVFARSHTWENCMKELYKMISANSHRKEKVT